MRDTLLKRWFHQNEGLDEEAEVGLGMERAKWSTFVESAGFKELESWVQHELDECEVRPGSHEEMLEAAGTRRGLRKVARKLREVKEFVLLAGTQEG